MRQLFDVMALLASTKLEIGTYGNGLPHTIYLHGQTCTRDVRTLT